MRFIRRKNGDIFLHMEDLENVIRSLRPVERPDGPGIYYAEEGRRSMCDDLVRQLGGVQKEIESRLAERESEERGRKALKKYRV